MRKQNNFSLLGLLVKWLTHNPLKVTFTGSNPVQATINLFKTRESISSFLLIKKLINNYKN